MQLDSHYKQPDDKVELHWTTTKSTGIENFLDVWGIEDAWGTKRKKHKGTREVQDAKNPLERMYE